MNQPTAAHQVTGWLRTQSLANTLANLAGAYLRQSEAVRIERLLLNGRHDRAAQHFCDWFSRRHFPLEYPWTGGRDNRLLIEVASGIQHESYGENWEELGDLWSLKPVFLLSWALIEDPYGALRDEFMDDERECSEAGDTYRLCDEARDAVAQFAQLDVGELFASVPTDGFSHEYLRQRFNGTCWEPLLWAAPWLWRLSGNRFLDQTDEDNGEPEPWSLSTVLGLSAEYREALRMTRAINSFDTWLSDARTDRTRLAVHAASGPPCDRISIVSDLPLVTAHSTDVAVKADSFTRRER